MTTTAPAATGRRRRLAVLGVLACIGIAFGLPRALSSSSPEEVPAPAPTSAAPVPPVQAVEPVEDAADRFMALFCRPGVTRAQWMANLAPLAAPAYAAQLPQLDPAGVPCTKVTGHGPGAGNPGSNARVVPVFTDAGTVRVFLEQQVAGGWLVTDVTN